MGCCHQLLLKLKNRFGKTHFPVPNPCHNALSEQGSSEEGYKQMVIPDYSRTPPRNTDLPGHTIPLFTFNVEQILALISWNLYW